MTKVVYNDCFGGFGLSDKALKRYNDITGKERKYCWDMDRADPALVQVVEELGKAASSDLGSLKIAEVPEGTKYRIDEYDGNERIMTIDDYAWSIA